jgi:hypothetical protein
MICTQKNFQDKSKESTLQYFLPSYSDSDRNSLRLQQSSEQDPLLYKSQRLFDVNGAWRPESASV